MPELPDLLHVVATLRQQLLGKQVTAERVAEPIVLRFLVRGYLSLLMGRRLADIARRAHFVIFRFDGLDLCVNPMLAGRFRLADPGEKREASLAFGLTLDGAVELRYLDDKKMGKAYLTATDDWTLLGSTSSRSQPSTVPAVPIAHTARPSRSVSDSAAPAGRPSSRAAGAPPGS